MSLYFCTFFSNSSFFSRIFCNLSSIIRSTNPVFVCSIVGSYELKRSSSSSNVKSPRFNMPNFAPIKFTKNGFLKSTFATSLSFSLLISFKKLTSCSLNMRSYLFSISALHLLSILPKVRVILIGSGKELFVLFNIFIILFAIATRRTSCLLLTANRMYFFLVLFVEGCPYKNLFMLSKFSLDVFSKRVFLILFQSNTLFGSNPCLFM